MILPGTKHHTSRSKRRRRHAGRGSGFVERAQFVPRGQRTELSAFAPGDARMRNTLVVLCCGVDRVAALEPRVGFPLSLHRTHVDGRKLSFRGGPPIRERRVPPNPTDVRSIADSSSVFVIPIRLTTAAMRLTTAAMRLTTAVAHGLTSPQGEGSHCMVYDILLSRIYIS